MTNAFTQSLDQGGDGRCLAETGYQANGNNPLSLVDPSGHFFGVIFAIVALVGQIVSAVFAVIGLLAIAVMKAITAVVLAGKVLLAKAVKFTMAVVKTSYGWMKTVGSKLITAVKAGWSQGLANLTWGTVAKGAGLNAAWSGIQTARHGGSWKDVFRSAAKGAVIGAIGAVTGAFMHGFGAGAGSWASSAAEVAAAGGKSGLTGTMMHAAAHGVSGGALAAANGGSFKDGFIGGAIGFGVGLPFGGAGGMIQGSGLGAIAARTAIAAVGGGVGSKLAGGSFADGAYSVAFFHLFNNELEVLNQLLVKGNENLARPGKGVDYEYFNNNEQNKAYSKNQWDADNVLTIGIHGHPNRVVDTSGNKPIFYNASKFGKMVMGFPEYASAEVVVLYSCNVGNIDVNPNPFAQQLADYLNKPVIAPTRALWVDSKGYASAFGMVGGGMYLPGDGTSPVQNRSDPGVFKIFRPRIKIKS